MSTTERTDYECLECGIKFESTRSLLLHTSRCHSHNTNLKVFKCSKCGTQLISTPHPQDDTNVNDDSYYECKACDIKYSNIKTSFLCSVCRLNYENNIEFLNHLRELHKDEKIEKPFQCSHCPSSHPRHFNLIYHLKKMHGINVVQTDKRMARKFKKTCSKDENSFSCSKCSEEFENKMDFISHFRESHLYEVTSKTSGEKQFKCSECPAIYSSSTKLKLHLKIQHKITKKVDCSLNLLQFFYKNLKKWPDENSDTLDDGKRYECACCDVSFEKNSDFIPHFREFHMDVDKKFKCLLCPAQFNYNESLSSHEKKSGHYEKSYARLNETIRTINEQIKNKILEHDETPFACPYCDLKFSKEKALRGHFGRFHQEEIIRKKVSSNSIPNPKRKRRKKSCQKTDLSKTSLISNGTKSQVSKSSNHKNDVMQVKTHKNSNLHNKINNFNTSFPLYQIEDSDENETQCALKLASENCTNESNTVPSNYQENDVLRNFPNSNVNCLRSSQENNNILENTLDFDEYFSHQDENILLENSDFEMDSNILEIENQINDEEISAILNSLNKDESNNDNSIEEVAANICSSMTLINDQNEGDNFYNQLNRSKVNQQEAVNSSAQNIDDSTSTLTEIPNYEKDEASSGSHLQNIIFNLDKNEIQINKNNENLHNFQQLAKNHMFKEIEVSRNNESQSFFVPQSETFLIPQPQVLVPRKILPMPQPQAQFLIPKENITLLQPQVLQLAQIQGSVLEMSQNPQFSSSCQNIAQFSSNCQNVAQFSSSCQNIAQFSNFGTSSNSNQNGIFLPVQQNFSSQMNHNMPNNQISYFPNSTNQIAQISTFPAQTQAFNSDTNYQYDERINDSLLNLVTREIENSFNIQRQTENVISTHQNRIQSQVNNYTHNLNFELQNIRQSSNINQNNFLNSTLNTPSNSSQNNLNAHNDKGSNSQNFPSSNRSKTHFANYVNSNFNYSPTPYFNQKRVPKRIGPKSQSLNPEKNSSTIALASNSISKNFENLSSDKILNPTSKNADNFSNRKSDSLINLDSTSFLSSVSLELNPTSLNNEQNISHWKKRHIYSNNQTNLEREKEVYVEKVMDLSFSQKNSSSLISTCESEKLGSNKNDEDSSQIIDLSAKNCTSSQNQEANLDQGDENINMNLNSNLRDEIINIRKRSSDNLLTSPQAQIFSQHFKKSISQLFKKSNEEKVGKTGEKRKTYTRKLIPSHITILKNSNWKYSCFICKRKFNKLLLAHHFKCGNRGKDSTSSSNSGGKVYKTLLRISSSEDSDSYSEDESKSEESDSTLSNHSISDTSDEESEHSMQLDNAFNCSFCKSTFSSCSDLKSHMKLTHPTKVSCYNTSKEKLIPKTTNRESISLRCLECEEIFIGPQKLMEHFKLSINSQKENQLDFTTNLDKSSKEDEFEVVVNETREEELEHDKESNFFQINSDYNDKSHNETSSSSLASTTDEDVENTDINSEIYQNNKITADIVLPSQENALKTQNNNSCVLENNILSETFGTLHEVKNKFNEEDEISDKISQNKNDLNLEEEKNLKRLLDEEILNLVPLISQEIEKSLKTILKQTLVSNVKSHVEKSVQTEESVQNKENLRLANEPKTILENEKLNSEIISCISLLPKETQIFLTPISRNKNDETSSCTYSNVSNSNIQKTEVKEYETTLPFSKEKKVTKVNDLRVSLIKLTEDEIKAARKNSLSTLK